MILIYILIAMLALFLLYVLFWGICCLFINPEKEYDRNSPFYRFLLNSATAATIKLLRIHVHTNGIEKIPKLSLMLFHGAGRLRSLCVFPSIFKGKHVLHRNMVAVHTGDEITVEFDRPTPLQIDGETIPDVTKYTARSAMLNMEEKKDHDFLISVTGQVSNAAVRQ